MGTLTMRRYRNAGLLKTVTLACAVLCLSPTTSVHSAEQMPSRQERDLVMAAVNIGMTEEQRYAFRDLIAEFIQNYRSAMLKITRGHNATDLDRRMEKKHKALLSDLDEEVAVLLSPPQFERYQTYRTLFEAALTRRQSPSSDKYLDLEIPPANHH